MPKSLPKCIQTCFRVISSKKNLCPVFHGGSSFRKFQIFFSKFQKCPKLFPKVSKRVLNMFWGKFFEKFLPSFPCKVDSSKFFKKNISKFQKCPKVFPKVSKRVLNVFCGTFRKIFAQFSTAGRVLENFQKNQKNFKIPKMPKIVPKSIQTCFELVFGQIFRKIFLPSFPWNVESSKIFKKNISKFQKCPKVFPNVSKRVLG